MAAALEQPANGAVEVQAYEIYVRPFRPGDDHRPAPHARSVAPPPCAPPGQQGVDVIFEDEEMGDASLQPDVSWIQGEHHKVSWQSQRSHPDRMDVALSLTSSQPVLNGAPSATTSVQGSEGGGFREVRMSQTPSALGSIVQSADLASSLGDQMQERQMSVTTFGDLLAGHGHVAPLANVALLANVGPLASVAVSSSAAGQSTNESSFKTDPCRAADPTTSSQISQGSRPPAAQLIGTSPGTAVASKPKGPSRQGSAASNMTKMRSWLSWPSDGGNLRQMSGLTMHSLRRTFECTPGQLSDFYVVDKMLGHGAFGQVMIAVSKASKEKVAVKAMPLTQARAFEREFDIAKRLKHPFIVRLLDMFKEAPGESAQCYLCMELCMGGDLMSYVRCHEEKTASGAVYMPPRTENIAQLMWQSLKGLDYLHHHCIAHRDIKAENYLRVNKSENAQIKLIDFGLSEHFMPGRRMKDRVGTMGYCAPETMQPGVTGYTEVCDLWSAGVLFYLICVGDFPIDIPKGTPIKEAHRITMTTEINYMRGAWKVHNKEAVEVVRLMLEKEAAVRQSAKKFLTNEWLRRVGREDDSGDFGCCCGLVR